MKKLKVAVQFFGHLRTFEKCFPSVKKNLLDLYDCDVFIHTWSKLDHDSHDKASEKNQKIEVDDNIIQRVHQLYNPKVLQVDQPLPKKENLYILFKKKPGMNYIERFPFEALESMYHTKRMVNTLRKTYQEKNKIEYDCVLMIRPDIRLYSPFIIDGIVKQIQVTNSFARFCAVSISKTYKENIVIGNIKSDIIYFGTTEVMDSIANILSDVSYDSRKNAFNTESFYTEILCKNRITSYCIPYLDGKDWEIIRQKKKKRSQFISIRLNIKKKYFAIRILALLSTTVIDIKIKLFQKINVFFSIGKFK